ncbi:hypothetical protein JQX13_02130 [Archangium violaceum]|uniref:hypothetical protein n=1 Tax=Archangium violaceum TaxID=83451 RepID=UPI00193C765E|nr:hypothetical protein [Archangium violaceum]QRK08992.1 hypothetical protein JQX13_02130 [Archangium violaceum]
MNLRLMGLGTGGVVLAATLGACGSVQQDAQCVVARAVSDGSTGSFAATYTLKPGQDATASCSQHKPGKVGLQKYFSQDPNAKDTVAIRTEPVGTLMADSDVVLDPDAPSQPNSVGELTTDAPGPDNFCEVPTLTPTRLVARTPALDLTYAWSNLRIYNTPDVPGTQFVADLRYTENDCTAEYTVKGIWPVVSCWKEVELDTDADGDGKKDKVKVPDEPKCDPDPDPENGRLRGSGINPSFPVKCDPDALICVLTGEVPSVP